MLGKHNRTAAALDRSRSDWSATPRRRVASFAKKIQQRRQPLPVASEEDIEVTVDDVPHHLPPPPFASTRNRDFVTQLRQLARAHVAERSRSVQMGQGDDKQQLHDESSTAATENTADDNVTIEEKKKELNATKVTRNEEEPQGTKTARPFRPFKEIFDWTEWTRCGPCAVGWKPKSGGGGVSASPLDKRSTEQQTRLYQHSMLEQQITPEDTDEIYAPPVDFDMDKTIVSLPSSIPHAVETDREESSHQQQLSDEQTMSIGTRWTMSYATGATTDYTRSYAGADSSASSYASSLYSSFASEPLHFDDSTTITTNY